MATSTNSGFAQMVNQLANQQLAQQQIATYVTSSSSVFPQPPIQGWTPYMHTDGKVYFLDPNERELFDMQTYQPMGINIDGPSQYPPLSITGASTAKKKVVVRKAVKPAFDSVVIAEEKKQQILDALEQVNQADLIFNTWGFGETIEKGRGVSLLFYGEPGTGKTLMAQAIAHQLKRELKVIAVADIESNIPGEAERNIRKYFKDAQAKEYVLLFDECDSLIYTRRNVGPIMASQVNELLSQLEKFDGVTIFTTNRLGTLDEAVNRRLALKLEFGMPSPEERAKIWQRMFPKKAPLAEDVDWLKLASVELAGGYIKNAVLRAARMAAAEKKPNKEKKIEMRHLVTSLKHEAESMMAFDRERHEYEHGAGYAFTGAIRQSGQGVTIERDTRKAEAVESGL